jgi:hypothetical protein
MPAFIVNLVLTIDSPPLVIGLVADQYDPNARPVRDNRTASLIVRSQLPVTNSSADPQGQPVSTQRRATARRPLRPPAIVRPAEPSPDTRNALHQHRTSAERHLETASRNAPDRVRYRRVDVPVRGASIAISDCRCGHTLAATGQLLLAADTEVSVVRDLSALVRERPETGRYRTASDDTSACGNCL